MLFELALLLQLPIGSHLLHLHLFLIVFASMTENIGILMFLYMFLNSFMLKLVLINKESFSLLLKKGFSV